jgi:hypothetical protein
VNVSYWSHGHHVFYTIQQDGYYVQRIASDTSYDDKTDYSNTVETTPPYCYYQGSIDEQSFEWKAYGTKEKQYRDNDAVFEMFKSRGYKPDSRYHGDICAYLSGGKWRLPTMYDFSGALYTNKDTLTTNTPWMVGRMAFSYPYAYFPVIPDDGTTDLINDYQQFRGAKLGYVVQKNTGIVLPTSGYMTPKPSNNSQYGSQVLISNFNNISYQTCTAYDGVLFGYPFYIQAVWINNVKDGVNYDNGYIYQNSVYWFIFQTALLDRHSFLPVRCFYNDKP